jgi:hypothetical protein
MITLNRFTRSIVPFTLAALLVAAPLANSSPSGKKPGEFQRLRHLSLTQKR